MQVSFTQHAVERMQQRLNVAVVFNTKVNIAPMFTKVYTYINHVNGRKVSAWASKDALKKCVLVVDCDKQAVVTIYLEVDPATGNKCPFCAKCYAMLTKK